MPDPLPIQEAARLAVLKSYHILDTGAEQAYDDITMLAAHVCKVPIALISLVDESKQSFKSKVVWEQQQTSRDGVFFEHAILQTEPLIVNDALKDVRFAANPLVTGEPHIRFYAGFPLLSAEGFVLGTVSVNDREPRQLSPAQKKAMLALARQVMVLLELRRVSARLMEALSQVKISQKLLLICAWCNSVRDEQGRWEEIEEYFRKNAEVNFSHTVCPECRKKMRPDERLRIIGS